MADNETTNSYEAMKAELFEAGYQFSWEVLEHGGKTYRVVFPNRLQLEDWNHDETVNIAWKDYQANRRAAELEAFVKEIADWDLDGKDYEDDEEITNRAWHKAGDFKERAQALVGRE